MGFIERGKTESLAEHLLKNAEVLGADAVQVSRLRLAFRLSNGTNAQKTEAGQIAAQVRTELKDALEVRLRDQLQEGERVAAYNDAGARRIKGRDGLESLADTGALTDVQAKAGLAFRLCFEASIGGLGSVLGKAGEGASGARLSGLRRSAAELHRAYLLARLNQCERAVAAIMLDGRELHALRLIAGEGRTVFEVAGKSGHARDAYKAALVRALDAVARALRITGS